METLVPIPTRILLVAPYEVVRRGLRHLLSEDSGVAVVVEIGDAREAAASFVSCTPDLMLLGLGSAGGGERLAGIAAVEAVTTKDPWARVVAVVDGESAEDVIALVRAGAKGVVGTEGHDGEVMDIVHAVALGDCVLGRQLTCAVFGHLLQDDAPAADHDLPESLAPPPNALDLTGREQQVLAEMAHGFQNSEIAVHLEIASGTVKTHAQRIYRKLGVRGRTAAVLLALEAAS